MNEQQQELTPKNVCYISGVVAPNRRLQNGFECIHLPGSGVAKLDVNLLFTETKTTNGQTRDFSTYIPVTVWGAKAEEFSALLYAGAFIEVKGKYVSNLSKKPDAQGNKRRFTNIEAYAIEVKGMGKLPVQNQAPQQGQGGYGQQTYNQPAPAPAPTHAPAPAPQQPQAGYAQPQAGYAQPPQQPAPAPAPMPAQPNLPPEDDSDIPF